MRAVGRIGECTDPDNSKKREGAYEVKDWVYILANIAVKYTQ